MFECYGNKKTIFNRRSSCYETHNDFVYLNKACKYLVNKKDNNYFSTRSNRLYSNGKLFVLLLETSVKLLKGN